MTTKDGRAPSLCLVLTRKHAKSGYHESYDKMKAKASTQNRISNGTNVDYSLQQAKLDLNVEDIQQNFQQPTTSRLGLNGVGSVAYCGSQYSIDHELVQLC